MKVGRQYIGKLCEVIWRDPIQGLRVDPDRAPKGEAALATWREFGILSDLTDGVLRIDHSVGENPPGDIDRGREVLPSYVQEAIVERITVLVPEGPDNGGKVS